MEEKNVGHEGKNPKQDLISAKDLIIEFTEGHESLYHRSDKLTNIAYSP